MKEERLLVAVVADGHGGQKASKYCSEKIIHHMEEFAQGNPSMESLSEACTQAFRKAHAVICALPGPRPGTVNTAGTTLTMVIINEDRRELVVANVGDSAAICYSPGESKHEQLSADHRLENNAEERARVRAAGSKLGQALDANGRPSGPVRVWPGGVCMARSIGDADAGAAVEPTPFVITRKIPAQGITVIAGSDGVWDSITMSAVRRIAKGCAGAEKAVQAIVRKAVTAHQAYASEDYGKPRDDTTCVCIDFYPPASEQGDCKKPKKGLFGRKKPTKDLAVPAAKQDSYEGKEEKGAKDLEGTVTKASAKFGRVFNRAD